MVPEQRAASNGAAAGSSQHMNLLQNYANVDCGAKVAAANNEAQVGTSIWCEDFHVL